jgi:hypothetical protein
VPHIEEDYLGNVGGRNLSSTVLQHPNPNVEKYGYRGGGGLNNHWRVSDAKRNAKLLSLLTCLCDPGITFHAEYSAQHIGRNRIREKSP